MFWGENISCLQDSLQEVDQQTKYPKFSIRSPHDTIWFSNQNNYEKWKLCEFSELSKQFGCKLHVDQSHIQLFLCAFGKVMLLSIRLKKINVTSGVRLVYFWLVKKIRVVVFVFKFMLHRKRKKKPKWDLGISKDGNEGQNWTWGQVKRWTQDKPTLKSLETVFKCWQEKERIDRFEEFSQNIVTLRSSGYNRKLLTENHIDTLDWSLNRSGITFHIFTTVFIV